MEYQAYSERILYIGKQCFDFLESYLILSLDDIFVLTIFLVLITNFFFIFQCKTSYTNTLTDGLSHAKLKTDDEIKVYLSNF